MEVLKCKFADEVLIPDNGIYCADKYETSDGVPVLVEYVCTWHNINGAYDEELDRICQKKWGIGFGAMRSIWIGRLGRVGDYWYLIKLIRLEPKKGL